MSTTKVRSNDMKFEIVVIPVSDVDRAKEFYGRLGWRLDAEFASGDDFRVIQFTPPGSGCSVIFGKNVTAAAPGSAQGLYLIVSDIVAARDELRGRGVEVSEVFHSDGVYAGTDEPYLFGRRRTSGPDPARGSYRSFASFRDPDGNGWLFQEVTTRLAGRIDSGVTTFASANDLAAAFRRAEAAHGKYEARLGQGGMRTGRSGTPRTWSRSRRAPSCRRDCLRRDRHRHRPGRPLRDLASRGRRNEGRGHRAQRLRRNVRQYRLHSDQDDGGERVRGAHGRSRRRVWRGRRLGACRHEAGHGPKRGGLEGSRAPVSKTGCGTWRTAPSTRATPASNPRTR